MTMTTASALVQANLQRVFNERDAGLRARAIRELYAADAKLYDEQEAVSSGREDIARAVSKLLEALPPTLVFSMVAPAMQNHDMGKLLWRGHLPDGTTVVTGTDVAQVADGRISSLHVFVDAASAK
jgi:SnoaL-like domain